MKKKISALLLSLALCAGLLAGLRHRGDGGRLRPTPMYSRWTL